MRVAIAGLGNVGAATLRLLNTHKDLLRARTGQDILVVAVSARDKALKRNCDLSDIEWNDDPIALVNRKDVDLIIEVIGGADGIALELAKSAFKAGKHFVTANKAMISTHGVDLAALAEKAKLHLAFEGAVCGGVPVLKLLREGLAANHISAIKGILNGTCNYILTRMEEKQISFADALEEAQTKGYAEKDPADDIDGTDSAYKLSLLTSLAFGLVPNFSGIYIEGIRDITTSNLRDAHARGQKIKLLGIATRSEQGVSQRVQPVFVENTHTLASVRGAANAIHITGDFLGDIMVQGIGAGGDATASAIVGDIVDIARGHRTFAFGVPALNLQTSP